jgi:hypothetical protein
MSAVGFLFHWENTPFIIRKEDKNDDLGETTDELPILRLNLGGVENRVAVFVKMPKVHPGGLLSWNSIAKKSNILARIWQTVIIGDRVNQGQT